MIKLYYSNVNEWLYMILPTGRVLRVLDSGRTEVSHLPTDFFERARYAVTYIGSL